MPAKSKRPIPLADLLEPLRPKLRPPLGIILGSPREAADLVAASRVGETVCYQMDLHQSDRLGEELDARGLHADIATQSDLWDLPQALQTLVYPIPKGGERALKLDMMEQAYHALAPQGTLLVLTPFAGDTFVQPALKKIFGKVHVPHETGHAAFWCQRAGERPRRRHEMSFHVRVDEHKSLAFVSRPGVFSYGRFDHGARALTEVADVLSGDRIVDLGCGIGTNGILAAQRAGPDGFITFVDSNVRAIALSELNARNLGVERFEAIATANLSGLAPESFDVVLANPPYYAQLSIAERFIECGRAALKKGGRFYLVSKLIEQMQPPVDGAFPGVEIFERRGYFIFAGRKP
jgi:16S rRNA (guanine1207-N2)-methyltransferase